MRRTKSRLERLVAAGQHGAQRLGREVGRPPPPGRRPRPLRSSPGRTRQDAAGPARRPRARGRGRPRRRGGPPGTRRPAAARRSAGTRTRRRPADGRCPRGDGRRWPRAPPGRHCQGVSPRRTKSRSASRASSSASLIVRLAATSANLADQRVVGAVAALPALAAGTAGQQARACQQGEAGQRRQDKRPAYGGPAPDQGPAGDGIGVGSASRHSRTPIRPSALARWAP